jgi:phosphohistidine phosphatase
MNLYLIRHGIAADLGPGNLFQDSQRPLTEAGRKKMRGIARGLSALDVNLDLILTSPYLRARETAAILADEFDLKGKLVTNEHLVPEGQLNLLIAEIREKYRVDHLALVGHEPSLSGLISLLLTGETGLAVTMKKGGVCCLSIWELISGRCATLEWLSTPAQLIRADGH